METVLSSIPHGTGGAVVNNPYARIFNHENYIYWLCKDVATGFSAVQIWDVKDPYNPIFKSHLVVGGLTGDSGDNYNDLFVSGKFLFVTLFLDGAAGAFIIVDISDKSNPAIVNTVKSVELSGGTLSDFKGPITLKIKGNYAYIAGFYAPKLTILDFTDKNNIVVSSQLTVHNQPYNSCFYLDNYIILCTMDPDPSIGGYIEVIDITDPAAPFRFADWRHGENNWDFKFRNFESCYPMGNILAVVCTWWFTPSRIVIALDLTNLPTITSAGGLVTSGNSAISSQVALGEQILGNQFLITGWTGNAERWQANINNTLSHIGSEGVGSQNGGYSLSVSYNPRNFTALITSSDVVLYGENVLPPIPEDPFYLHPVAVFGFIPGDHIPLISTFGYFDFTPPGSLEVPDLKASLNLFIEQLRRRENVQAIANLFIIELEKIRDALIDIFRMRDIDLMSGEALDFDGALVGEDRQGNEDIEYRDNIRVRIALNNSGGEAEIIMDLFRILAKPVKMHFMEIYPAKYLIEYSSPYFPPDTLYSELKKVTAGGVGIRISWTPDEIDNFGFDGEGGILPEEGTAGFSEEGSSEEGGAFIELLF